MIVVHSQNQMQMYGFLYYYTYYKKIIKIIKYRVTHRMVEVGIHTAQVAKPMWQVGCLVLVYSVLLHQ